MGRMVGIFWDIISENYLEFLVVGNEGGLFWSFVLEGILSVSIIVILSFVWVYLAIGF